MDSPGLAPHKQPMQDTTRPLHAIPLRAAETRWSARPTLLGLAAAALLLTLAAAITTLTRSIWPETSGLYLFFAAVLLSATRYGFWVGIASALAAFALFNFFFVEPLYTLRVDNPADFMALAEFLLMAALTGFLAGRLREEADAAKSRAEVLEVLSDFAADLAQAKDADAILQIVPRHLATVGQGRAMVLCQRDGLELFASFPPGTQPLPDDLAAADRAVTRQSVQVGVQPGWDGSPLTFVPLGTVVLGYGTYGPSTNLAFREQALAVICRQVSLALDRFTFAAKAEAARIAADREALRAALLTSLSHDLRTPLATILGSITTLRELGASLPEAARRDLELAIEEETQRLSRHVDNLLHMTRLQTGLVLRLTWVDPGEVVDSAVARAKRAFPNVTFAVNATDLPLIRAEAGLLEQALFNLIDNAVKFSPKPATLWIDGHVDHHLRLTVRDAGSGIEPAVLPQIFTPFFRAAPHASSGTGLGLTICQGIVQALGGTLTAESPTAFGPGSAFHIDLALAEPP